MQRRDLLKLITVATGAALTGLPALAYEKLPPVPLEETGFSKEDVQFLNDVGEVILPATDTPGAKDANVGQIMAVLVADCYTKEQQALFKKAMSEIEARANKQHSKPFMLLTAEQKYALISELDTEALAYNRQNDMAGVEVTKPSRREPDSTLPLPHPYSLIKQLVLFSFFTSEVGATKVLRYVAIPGRYDGNMPYKKGDRAWAT